MDPVKPDESSDNFHVDAAWAAEPMKLKPQKGKTKKYWANRATEISMLVTADDVKNQDSLRAVVSGCSRRALHVNENWKKKSEG